MPEPVIPIEPRDGADLPASAPDALGMSTCPRCHDDLSRVQSVARFCPHCGIDLRNTRQADVAPAETAEQAPAVSHQWHLFGSQSAAAQAGRSSLVRGFAKALFRLGRRYEEGLGAAHNRQEAARCYQKAAILGDAEALERLPHPPALPEPTSSLSPDSAVLKPDK